MSLDSDWWVRGGRVQALTKLKTSSLAMLGILVLLVMEAMVKSKKTLTQLSASLLMYPQVLINIKALKKINVDKHAEIQAVVLAAESELAGTGRVLLRSSGTEPLIRIMVEGENRTQVENLAQRIADIVEAATLN